MSATPQVIFQTILAVENNLGNNAPQVAEINLQNPTFNYTTMYFNPYFPVVGGAGSNVPFPVLTIFALAVRNISTIPIKVTLNPNGSVPAVFNLGPNGVFIICDSTKAGAGFALLNLTSTGGPVYASVMVAV
jgi:hypothetical protein